MRRVKFYIALWISKVAVVAINIIDKKKGTNLSGKIAVKICNEFIGYFKGIDFNKTVIITGTNGKSTTNNIIINALKTSGKTIATNLEGANLMTGIATALIKNSRISGKIKTEFCIFEVDERSFASIYKLFPAKHICVTNIQKDQVQRNGEPDYIYQKLYSVLNEDMTLYLNNEEPRSKSFGGKASKAIYYGIEENEKSFDKNDFYDITMPCPNCNNKVEFEYFNVDNIGKFRCSNCEYKSEEEIKYYARNIDYANGTFECLDNKFNMNYTTPFFIYNYMACIAVCMELGISIELIKQSFNTFVNISGRMETINYKEKTIKYVRLKQENPETLQSVFNYISEDGSDKVIIIGLCKLMDFAPYYTNTFYSFDCNCDKMINSNVEKFICFSESVCYDTSNRLIYSGAQEEKIITLNTDDAQTILDEIDKCKTNNIYLVTWLKTYEEVNKFIEKMETKA